MRRIPADAATRLVIALGLFADLSIPQVWRRLHPATDAPDPVESALAQARARLGVRPLRELFDALARPMATHQTIGASYRGWRLMALDGTTLDLPDTPANARAFGRPGTDRAEGAFPQLRLLALCELGTRAICGLAIKPGRRSEQVMAGPLIDRLEPGMLLIWDRGFFGFPLAERVIRAGAHLLARVPSGALLAPTRRLDDGSYLSELRPPRGWPGPVLTVRVIEYTHDDPNRPGCGQRNRLLTDLLSPDQLPAAEAPLGVPRAVGAGTGVRRVEDPPERTGGTDPEQDPGRRGAGGVRVGAGPLPDPAGDPRRGGDRVGGPGPVIVRRYSAGTVAPAAGITGGTAVGLVSGLAAGGAAPAPPAPAPALVPTGDQAEDVQLGKEAERTSASAPAD
ncbi:MAG: IS4 family transposase [Planctomycetes bacterium]|nr:IS4 family transposase [Planctomycetota bacterium]